ncbi:putative outer membrane protein [Fulvivirga imtechensis AK7]|uniref:Putative outer membrane protein n=1 Tax=Fulvivirga imtechensis AK7 TaxID=1237149 RepID=L8JUD4_9BACT|nr:putative outer membrane protein [Fulvivirga imtechensis AK7]
MGTVSNKIGEFDFHIPAEHKNGRMVISMLGYESMEALIQNLMGRDTLIFRLNKAVKVLDEVIIKDSLSGGDIVSIAISRIEQNYPMTPFMLDGFYRDIKKVGGIYSSLLEAAVKIYDEDYKEPRNKIRLRERVALIEVRKSLGYNNKFAQYFDQKNLLEELLLHNTVRYRQFSDEALFFDSFKRQKTSFYNGRRVHVVALRSDDYFLKMYIGVNNYAIIRLEYERVYPADWVVKKKNSIFSRYVSDKKVIDFKEFQGKMYLNYMNLTSKINWYNEKSGDLKFETELYQELLINKVYTEPDERIASSRKMRRYGLQYQDQRYNKEFWDNYNVIKETPLDQEIVRDLEKSGGLDEQFDY